MVGGAKFQDTVLKWTKQSDSMYFVVFVVLIGTWATFADKIPAEWRWQLSTTFGRLLLLLLLYIVHMMTGWIPTLLFALAIGLTWANRPLLKPLGVSEGFQPGIKKTKVNKEQLWFSERLFNENPKAIVEDRVNTDAVQDSTQYHTGRVSR